MSTLTKMLSAYLNQDEAHETPVAPIALAEFTHAISKHEARAVEAVLSGRPLVEGSIVDPEGSIELTKTEAQALLAELSNDKAG